MQIVVLTALNNAADEQMTVRELKAATKMETAPLCDVVAGLSTAGIVLVTEPAADAGIGRCVWCWVCLKERVFMSLTVL